jgi:hypothetical protein
MSVIQLNIYIYLIYPAFGWCNKFSVLMTELTHTLAGRIRVPGEELSKRTQNNIWSISTASLVVRLKIDTFNFFGFSKVFGLP